MTQARGRSKVHIDAELSGPGSSGSTPTDEQPASSPTTDAHPWRATVLLTLSLIVGTFVWTMLVNPAIAHVRSWMIAGDAWPPLSASRFVATGAYPYLYEADSTWVAGPVLPILLAPIAAIQDALGMTSRVLGGYGFFVNGKTVWIGSSAPGSRLTVSDVPRPSVWWLYATYSMALAIPLLVAVRRTAAHVVGFVRGRLPAATQIVVTGLGLLVAAAYYMHIEDALAVALLLFALLAGCNGKRRAAGVMIGIAIATKQWAALGALPLIFSTPARERRSLLLPAIGIPLVLYGVPLAIDPTHAIRALFRAGSAPWLGHAAPWISDARATRVVGATEGRLVWLGLAVAVACFARRRPDLDRLLAAQAVIFGSRLLIESVVYSYYLLPVIVFVVLLEVAQRRSVLRTTIAGTAAMAWYWVPPPHVWWWFVELAFVIALVWPALRVVATGIRKPERQGDSIVSEARPGANEAPDPTPRQHAVPSTTG